MKQNSMFGWLLVGFILFTVIGCQKSKSTDQELSATDQITTLVDRSWEGMAGEELFTGDPSGGIDMQNNGIASDFLVDESYLDDTQIPNGDPTIRLYIREHSFIRCLRGLQLSEEQTGAIRQNLRIYEACKDHAVQRARAIYLELRQEYRFKYQRLWNAWQTGSLTEREFRAKVAQLRIDFRHALLRLHLREKLDEAFKRCLRSFLTDLHGILTERQWNAFVECYKGT
ncbi:MAG: hypothetical protein V1733_08675 [bacterium]